jgi:hypothetical protein
MMANWTEKNKKVFAASKVMEPKSKMARLRVLLPELETARAAGHTLADIRAQLAMQGIEFPSHGDFQKLYWLARKAGPLGQQEPGPGTSGVSEARQSATAQVSRSSLPPAERLPGGAVIIRPTTKDTRINKHPNLKDLI